MPIAPKRACLVPGCMAYAEARGRCREHAAPILEALAQARRDEPGRRWYHCARWRKLRQTILSRQPLCVRCQETGCATPATELDHRVPHKGDSKAFWDVRNLDPLCHPHHVEKTRQERRQVAKTGG